MNLTNDDVQEILRLLDASPFDELILHTERFKLTLRRSSAGGWTQERHTLAAQSASSAVAGVAQPSVATKEAAAPPPATRPGTVEVRPPIMGTF